MSEPFVAEIRIFACNFAPRGWALCNGQLLPIIQNTALFSLLGTNYGGDGRTTFGLPNFQGTVPVHTGDGPGLTPRFVGETFGTETVTLLTSEMPNHRHVLIASTGRATAGSPEGGVPAVSARELIYDTVTDVAMASPSPAGGSQPHNNIQPSLTFIFCIALAGVFPSRG